MERPVNPRYPHRCKIVRKMGNDPLVDEDDATTLLSDEYDPLNDEQEVENGEEEEGKEQTEVVVVYEGVCRSYETQHTSDKGDVITSYRGLALPITQDEWLERDTIPQEGDDLMVDRGAYKEYGKILDRNPANFGGTHFVWKFGRN